jgi:phosphoribosylamine--glycine ligase
MRVLVVGSGGREHALVYKLSRSPRLTRLFCAPGNAGICSLAECVDVSPEDIPGLLALAQRERIDLTVVGPEAPLCKGITDIFRKEGLRIFGPSQRAAELEGSKTFAKNLMGRYLIPTAQARSFRRAEEARRYVRDSENLPVVVKASGLAAGKGVSVCATLDEADTAIDDCLKLGKFGDAGSEILIEDFLEGEEASILALTDGKTIATLEPSQDHKAALDDDKGPNTGGMGAYSPAPIVSPALLNTVEREIVVPVVHAMNRTGRSFQGVLYAGLMVSGSGAKVLEFNVRFGDPETQPLLLRLKTDLLDLLDAVVDGRLDEMSLEWDPRPAVCVVLTSEGYPGRYRKGDEIHGLDRVETSPDLQVFHSGTARVGGRVVTSGGRVLSVTALGDTLESARERVYEAVSGIEFAGRHFRTDIAAKGLQHLC